MSGVDDQICAETISAKVEREHLLFEELIRRKKRLKLAIYAWIGAGFLFCMMAFLWSMGGIFGWGSSPGWEMSARTYVMLAIGFLAYWRAFKLTTEDLRKVNHDLVRHANKPISAMLSDS